MRVLILGGTGVMGRYLVDIFHQKEVDVYVTSRKHNKSYDNINYILCDAKNTNNISVILEQGWDAIVDFMVYASLEEFKEKKDMMLRSTKQYIFMSSARVYADSDVPITEKSSRLVDVSTDGEYIKLE